MNGHECSLEAASVGFLPPGEILQWRLMGMFPKMKNLVTDPQCLENPTCDSSFERRSPKSQLVIKNRRKNV